MKSLSELKGAAFATEGEWQAARAMAITRLAPDEGLLDCTNCHRDTILRNDQARALWSCPCRPRAMHLVIRSRRR